jgi:hypothetical protein
MPAVQRIDHINIVTDAPGPLAATLSAGLGLPVSSPLVSLPTFDLAILAAGNATIEVQRFGWRRRTPDVATRAELAGLVFDTDDLAATLAELTRSGIPHVAPLVFDGPDTELHTYDGYRRSSDDPNWRVAVIDGVLSEELVSRRFSARPLAGSGPGALRMGRIMGRVASAHRLGRLAAPIFSPGPRFLAVCEWGHDKDARRAADRVRLEVTGNDGADVRAVREVTVVSPDVAVARERWERLLGPPDRERDHWTLDGGPALRLIEGPREQLGAMALEVSSLSQARDHLAAQDLIATDRPDELTIAPEPVGGLDIRIVAQARVKADASSS